MKRRTSSTILVRCSAQATLKGWKAHPCGIARQRIARNIVGCLQERRGSLTEQRLEAEFEIAHLHDAADGASADFR
jgi:hypothetical protein